MAESNDKRKIDDEDERRLLEMGWKSSRTSRWRFIQSQRSADESGRVGESSDRSLRARDVEQADDEGSESNCDIQGPSGLQMHEERLV